MHKRIFILSFLVAILALPASHAHAFCGFYVAKADTQLFNKASKVVIVRDEEKTVMTMANDYQGSPEEFAIVIPVPTAIEKGQIHVANSAVIDHLDSYSAPRLVEYYDEDPCRQLEYEKMVMSMPMAGGAARDSAARANSLGVTIEAQYTVGEYDIVILTAAQGGGLETWLNEEGYKIPSGAADILGSYIKQKMHFFVAKVNLKEHQKLGFSFLRPLQVAYNSPKFMLPIRLGMINANGPQDLFIFALTKSGRVETTNYRTVKLPEGMDVPLYVKDEFSDFYKSMFTTQVDAEGKRAVFQEYGWDMGWCDPCAAQPLSNDELKELGVFWLNDAPTQPIQPWMGARPQNAYLTRLHVRYDNEHFPEDLQFQQTSDRANFQARYVLRHPWTGSASCPAADKYRANLPKRQQEEVQTLARLTGWKIEDISKKAHITAPADGEGTSSQWWKDLWHDSK